MKEQSQTDFKKVDAKYDCNAAQCSATLMLRSDKAYVIRIVGYSMQGQLIPVKTTETVPTTGGEGEQSLWCFHALTEFDGTRGGGVTSHKCVF